MQRSTRCCGNERQIDLSLLHLGQLDLGFFCCFFKPLQSHTVCAEIDTMRRLELFDKPVNDALVPVVTTQMSVAMCALYFKDAVTDFENADIECATAKIEHQNGFVFAALVEPVCECGRGRLVNDPQNFKTCDLTCFFCCSALCVIEICGHSDDCLRHRSSEIRLGVALEFH